MTRYAYYHPATFKVIDWIDTSSLNVVLPGSVIAVDDEQWQLRDKNCWVCLEPLEFILAPPPGDFYRLQGNAWIYDEALFFSALEDVKAQVVKAVKSQRDVASADYIVIEGNHFHSDANSRIQQMSLTKMGQAKQIPANLMWQTKNNGLIPLTNEIAAQFETVTMEHDMRLFANAQRHIATVEAQTDLQTLQVYDYTTGWQP